MISLRPHQEEFIEKIRNAFKTHKCVMAQAPVGFGKTVVSAFMAKKILEKNNSLFFTVHRKDLITQTHRTFRKFNIPHGIISPDHIPAKKCAIQICSISSLQNRLEKYNPPKLIIIDEVHHCGAKGWNKVISYYKNKGCYILGLSASPWRLSQEGFTDYFDILIHGPETEWLIENKFLSEYKLLAPSTPNLDKVHKRMGEYVQSELEDLMDTPKITGCAIEHWNKHAKDKLTVCFCTSIKHSKDTAAAFNKAGIPAAHLDGECDIELRKEIINKFSNREIKVITNCNIFCEGFDLSSQVDKDITVESVILLRPTASLSLYIQQTGRALRYKPYPAIILDHANCVMTHGLPDQQRTWSLEGRKKDKKVDDGPKIKLCPECYGATQSWRKECPFCKHAFTVEAREVEQVAGTLEKIDLEALKIARKKQEGMAKTYDEFVAIGIARGYPKPHAWARIRMKFRKKASEW